MKKRIKLIDIDKYNLKKINFGCGAIYKENYINVDFPNNEVIYDRQKSPDLIGDFTEMDFKKESLDEVYLSHLFEHFQRYHAIILLIRFNQWLKINGTLDLIMPDVDFCMREFINCNDKTRKKELVRHMWGSHEGDWAIHMEGWYIESLIDFLNSCGFEIKNFKRVGGQWPYFEVISIKKNEFDLNKIKQILNSYSPDVPNYENKLLNYWMNEINKELK